MKNANHRKLLKYSALSASFLAVQNSAQAQAILYTDPTPDIFVKAEVIGYGYDFAEGFIDVDLDGVNDFRVFAEDFDSYSAFRAEVKVEPLAGNEIAASVYLSCYGFGDIKKIDAFDSGVGVSSGLNWVSNTATAAYIYVSSNYVACVDNVFALSYGDVKFIPIRLKSGAAWQYGWVRVELGSSSSIAIRDFAVNALLDQPILTGEGVGGPCDAPSGLSSTLTTPSSATLSWSSVPSADKYQVTGTLLGSGASYSKVTTSTAISASSLVMGIYTWEVRTRCLDGTVSLPSASASFVVPSPMAGGAAEHTDALRVSQNGRNLLSTFTVEEAGENYLALFDMTGALMEERKVQVQTGTNQIELDCSQLPAGVYLLSIGSKEGLISEKVVIK